MIRVLAREFYTFYVLFILDLDEICNCCLIEQKTIQHCLNNIFFWEDWGKCIGGKKQGIAGRDKNVITISCLRIFFSQIFTHMLYRFFFLSLAKCLHDFVFFFRRAWAQFYWLPRPREHNRVGSGLALRGSFIKCIFTNGN